MSEEVMTELNRAYFMEFPSWLENIVDAFLFTDGVDLETDEVARELKDRAHELRWDIYEWLETKR